MFEKETRFIHDICMNQINRLGSFVTFEELTGTELHPAVLKYISAEIDLMILEDRQKLLEYSNFDYTGEEMTDAFRQVGQIIKNSKKFPIDYISNLILLSISFNMNYLIRPRRTIVDFIYQNENVLNANFVKHMLNYTYYYSYIRKVFDKYSMKKALLTVPKSDFENILSRLDQEMFDSHTNRIMDTALNSIADFFNIGSVNKSKIPLSAIEPFLLEKNLENYLDRLHSAFPAVTKFSYSIPDVQRVIYSTAPIKRENYLDKAAQKKIQDSVLGLEENVVTPKEEGNWNSRNEKAIEEKPKAEFQEAEFTLIPENEENDTKSRLRSKSITVDKKDNEPKAEEVNKTESIKKEPDSYTNTSDDKRDEVKIAEEKVVQRPKPDKLVKDKIPEVVNQNDKIVNKKDKNINSGLLEAEEIDLLNLYDREIEIKENITGADYINAVNNEDDNEQVNSVKIEDIPDEPEENVITDSLPEQNSNNLPESSVEEEMIDSDEDEFIVVGEEKSVPGENPVIPDPDKVVQSNPTSNDKNDDLIPRFKKEILVAEDKSVKPNSSKYENIRKRRILVKKFKPSNGKDTPTNSTLADEPKDEVDQKKVFDETNDFIIETLVENNPAIEEQSEIKGDIFSCFTEKELQKILKGVFNDDAEDFALTLDTMSACNNYDEAVKLLRSLFRSYKIKHKSKEAGILKRAVSEYYSRSNDIDLI